MTADFDVDQPVMDVTGRSAASTAAKTTAANSASTSRLRSVRLGECSGMHLTLPGNSAEVARPALNFAIRAVVLVAMVYAAVVSLSFGSIFGWTIGFIAALVGVLDALRRVGAAKAVRARASQG